MFEEENRVLFRHFVALGNGKIKAIVLCAACYACSSVNAADGGGGGGGDIIRQDDCKQG